MGFLTHAHHRRGLEVEPKAAGQFLCFFWNKQLLFEHHSNQVWYLLEPSEKNNALNFESQLKNWVAQPLHAPVSLTYNLCPKRENTIFLIKCCEYMKNNVWQQNEINVLKFWLSFFFNQSELKSIFVPLPIMGYLTVKKKYSFLAIFSFSFITIKMQVVKVFIFAVFRHNSSTNRCSIGI